MTMILRRSRGLGAAAALLAAACSGSSSSSAPVIRLVEHPTDRSASYVEVTGIDGGTRSAVRRFRPDSEDWARVLEIRAIADDGRAGEAAVLGRYASAPDGMRFTPLYPFDPGRRYEVRFRPSAAGSRAPDLVETIALPAAPAAAPTYVTGVHPSGGELPENQLRIYINFSAPMGRRGGLDHVTLLDDTGRPVEEPFLPLDAEFWNGDRTRYTLFFDPGRQKRGILPNREMGPSLVNGRSYTLVVDRRWLDGHGQPLRETFEWPFRVGPPDLQPLDQKTWRVIPPGRATRQPLAIEFQEPLDHGLLMRGIGVRRDGQPVAGDIRLEQDERRWVFTPAEPWRPGRHEIVALSILEDLAGNRIGRAFEVDSFERVDRSHEPEITSIPFTLASTR
jgi:hypothetical protein